MTIKPWQKGRSTLCCGFNRHQFLCCWDTQRSKVIKSKKPHWAKRCMYFVCLPCWVDVGCSEASGKQQPLTLICSVLRFLVFLWIQQWEEREDDHHLSPASAWLCKDFQWKVTLCMCRKGKIISTMEQNECWAGLCPDGGLVKTLLQCHHGNRQWTWSYIMFPIKEFD